jgi:hypothetical protein
VLSYFHCVFSVILVNENVTNNLYLSGANRGYEVRGEACDTFGQKKQPKKGFLGGGTPLPESTPVDSHVLMRHIYRIWVQN